MKLTRKGIKVYFLEKEVYFFDDSFKGLFYI